MLKILFTLLADTEKNRSVKLNLNLSLSSNFKDII